MDNRKGMTLALLVIGLVGINFFYLSDMLFDGSADIVLGSKSIASIVGANLIALLGVVAVMRDRSRR